MNEVVEYIVHRPEREELVVQLTGGGAAVKFHGGMKVCTAVRRLRELAARLERGALQRARNQESAE
jgi:hypothetical protein